MSDLDALLAEAIKGASGAHQVPADAAMLAAAILATPAGRRIADRIATLEAALPLLRRLTDRTSWYPPDMVSLPAAVLIAGVAVIEATEAEWMALVRLAALDQSAPDR